MVLEVAHGEIGRILRNSWPEERFETVRLVHEQRLEWRPRKVRTILLAESHLYTEVSPDFQCFFTQQPSKFTRFVYCSAYGENTLLKNNAPRSNRGTPDYWKLFYSCCHPHTKRDDFFDPILKSTPETERLQNKREVLREMSKMGVWLLDASIVAVYHPEANGRRRLTPRLVQECMRVSFEYVLGPLLRSFTDTTVIPIGQNIGPALNPELTRIVGLSISKPVSQPNRRGMTREDWIPLSQELYSIANRTSEPASLRPPLCANGDSLPA